MIRTEEVAIGMIAIEIAPETENVGDVPDLEVWTDARKEEIVKEGAGIEAVVIATTIDEIESAFLEIEDLDLLIEIEKGVVVDLTENLENVEILETKESLVL